MRYLSISFPTRLHKIFRTRQRPVHSANPPTPEPLSEYAKKHSPIEDRNWEHYTTIRPVMRVFTRSDLARTIKFVYRRFYLRLSFIGREPGRGRLKDLAGAPAIEPGLRTAREHMTHGNHGASTRPVKLAGPHRQHSEAVERPRY